MLSGVKRLTLRLGHRKFQKNIMIHGYPAIVESVRYTTLMYLNFEILKTQGFINMFSTLMILRRFYPEITINSDLTVVEYRIVP